MRFTPDAADVLIDILRWRRDVRHFRRDPVPEETIARLAAVMELSPSVGNSRPWRVLRVCDPALREAVAANFERANCAAACAYDDEARNEYMRLKLAGLREAPEHLAVFTEIDPAEGRGLGRRTMPETLAFSTAMAINTLWLAARAENLGLGWVSILEPREVEQLLDVPPSWRLTAYLCLGQPAFEDDTPLLHRVGWQENVAQGWQVR